MLNKAMIIGRLGQDPELKQWPSGGSYLNMSVATDDSYTDRDGNRQEKTEWHRVAVSGRMAENCAAYLRKGSLVFVEGRIQTRKWQDAQGQDRQTTEIFAQRVQFLDRKGEGGQGGQGDGYGGRQGQSGYRGNSFSGQGRQAPRQQSGRGRDGGYQGDPDSRGGGRGGYGDYQGGSDPRGGGQGGYDGYQGGSSSRGGGYDNYQSGGDARSGKTGHDSYAGDGETRDGSGGYGFQGGSDSGGQGEGDSAIDHVPFG